MNFTEAKDEFVKWALLGLIGWIAIQVTDLKQNMAAITSTVTAADARTNRIADAIVRLMGTDTTQDQHLANTDQRVSKLEAKVFNF